MRRARPAVLLAVVLAAGAAALAARTSPRDAGVPDRVAISQTTRIDPALVGPPPEPRSMPAFLELGVLFAAPMALASSSGSTIRRTECALGTIVVRHRLRVRGPPHRSSF